MACRLRICVTASYGVILLPQETQDAAEAMRLVDQRMYAPRVSYKLNVGLGWRGRLHLVGVAAGCWSSQLVRSSAGMGRLT